MGWFDNQQNYDEMVSYNGQQPPEEHKAKFSHEFVGGAAAFGAMKLFEDEQRREGKTVTHAFAKEMLAGLAGAEVDRFAETTGENWVDKERAKHHAKKEAEQMYEQHYEQNHGADQYDPNRYQPHESYNRYNN